MNNKPWHCSPLVPSSSVVCGLDCILLFLNASCGIPLWKWEVLVSKVDSFRRGDLCGWNNRFMIEDTRVCPCRDPPASLGSLLDWNKVVHLCVYTQTYTVYTFFSFFLFGESCGRYSSFRKEFHNPSINPVRSLQYTWKPLYSPQFSYQIYFHVPVWTVQADDWNIVWYSKDVQLDSVWCVHFSFCSSSTLHQPTIKAENYEEQFLKFLELGEHFFLMLLCLRKHVEFLSPAESD